MNAEEFLNKEWPSNKIPLPIKEQWTDLMEAYLKHRVESVTDEMIIENKAGENYDDYVRFLAFKEGVKWLKEQLL